MFKISRLADYSMIILNRMVSHLDRRFSAAALSEQTGIPSPTVSKVLKILNEAKLLNSMRGTKGGYQIARLPEQISLAEVINAIDGQLAVTECTKVPHQCTHHVNCSLSDNWQRINQIILNFFENITLAEMSQPIMKKCISSNLSCGLQMEQVLELKPGKKFAASGSNARLSNMTVSKCPTQSANGASCD